MPKAKDTTFKYIGNKYLIVLIKLLLKFNIEIELDFDDFEILTSELIEITPSNLKPDFIARVGKTILMLEFESSVVGKKSIKRFKQYIAMFDAQHNDENLEIIFCVISTAEKSKWIEHPINKWNTFTFPIISIADMDMEKILSNVETKLKNNEEFSDEELIELALTPVMPKKRKDIIEQFGKTTDLVSIIPFHNDEIKDSVFGILLMLSNIYFNELDPVRKRIQGDIMFKVDSVKEFGDKRYGEGKDDGYSEGKDDGYSEGRDDGFSDGKIKIVKSMIESGELSPDAIDRISELSDDEVKEIKSELSL